MLTLSGQSYHLISELISKATERQREVLTMHTCDGQSGRVVTVLFRLVLHHGSPRPSTDMHADFLHSEASTFARGTVPAMVTMPIWSLLGCILVLQASGRIGEIRD